MWKEMNKLQKAGLVIGAIECVAGFGIAIYAHCKCKKESKEIEQIMETASDCSKEIDELLKTTGVMDNEE